MVELAGKTVLARQIEVFRACNIDRTAIVLGHGAQSVDAKRFDLKVFTNAEYTSTNMVESMMRARDLFNGASDIILSYGDIVYERRVLEAVLNDPHAISVAVDRRWRRLWQLRMEDPLSDAETMRLGPDGRIIELGKKPRSLDEIQGQYMGLFRVRANAAPMVVAFHDGLDRSKQYDGRDVPNMFMTSFIQAMIDGGLDIGAALVDGGWLEIDTIADLDRYDGLAATGRLAEYYDDRN
jgi:choline kinase